MRLVHETLQPLREPMITARLFASAIHALLNDGPFSVVGDDEAVEVEIETVLHRRAVDLGHQAARSRQRGSVKSHTVADREQFMRGLPRVFPAPAAYVDTEFLLQRRQPTFERADDAGGDAGRMPVHAHRRAE